MRTWLENNERHCDRDFAIKYNIIEPGDTTTTCKLDSDEYIYIHDFAEEPTLLEKLRKTFGEEVTQDYIKPLHDEDFEACNMICYNSVIVANPTDGYEICAKHIANYILRGRP